MALQRSIELQLCFHAAHPPWNPLFSFRGQVFAKRNFQTLDTPSVKRKSPWQNLLLQSRVEETQTTETSWFYKTQSHCACSPLQRNRLEAAKFHDFKKAHESTWKLMKIHKKSWKIMKFQEKIHETSWFSWGETHLPLEKLLNISPWSHSFAKSPPLFFLDAATRHVFAMRRAVTDDTASKNSPQTTRPCAPTHCKIIAQSRYHDFTALDWVATLLSRSASTLKSAF